MRNRLVDLTAELSNTYGVSSKIAKNIEKAYGGIDELRNHLDNVAGKDCPDKTVGMLNHCYYPGQEKRLA